MPAAPPLPHDKAAGFFGRRKGKALRDEQAARIQNRLPGLSKLSYFAAISIVFTASPRGLHIRHAV